MGTYRVIFDLDDTLYAERDFAHSGFRAVDNWANAKWGVTGLCQDMCDLLDAGYLGALFKIALAKHRPDFSDVELTEMQKVYDTHTPNIRLFEDARFALGHFAAKGPIGLITDGNAEMQKAKIESLGIAGQFARIIFTHEGGGRAYSKPHPWSYKLMEAELAEPETQFVYVGDNPAKDFVTPNAQGWISIQVQRARPIHDPYKIVEGGAPQHIVQTLDELTEILV